MEKQKIIDAMEEIRKVAVLDMKDEEITKLLDDLDQLILDIFKMSKVYRVKK